MKYIRMSQSMLLCKIDSVVAVMFICPLLQWCPESRGEPAGTPEEDRQCSPAAQGPSDAGAGGGVKSTYSTTCAMDLCGFHIPLLVGSGFWNIHFSGTHSKPKQKENSLFSAALYSDESNTTTRRKEKETGLPASHSRQITEERCTMGATIQVKVRLGSCWGEGELKRFFDVFH